MEEDLPSLIARRGRELNISNSEIARRADLSRSYIGNIINRTAPTKSGSYIVSPDVARRIAKAIEVSDREVAAAMDYLAAEIAPSEADKLADELARSVMASGFDDLEDPALREAFLEDMKSIADSMLRRKLEEQAKKKRD